MEEPMTPPTVNLPDLVGSYNMPGERVAEFREKGHTVLRGVASPEEIATYRPVIEAAVQEHGRETRPLEERDTYAKAFLQVPNLWRRDENVKRFVCSSRFAKIAADLLGVDGVRLYHDQALFKEAGGGQTPWHQDQYYWPIESDKTITMWIPLVDVPPEIGSMTFVSGSQRLGYLGSFPISDESNRAFEALIKERRLTPETHGTLVAGDATFHTGWILHSAPPNPTGTLRAVMTVIYYADGLRVAEPQNDGQRFDLSVWFRGLEPGDLAASERNPRLYPPETH
jgi:ectoine hydroxylase-related dioxygenase (phytanoyl-CoA dioxygenase family)